MHTLPPLGHPARDLFDVADLVDVSTGKRPLPCNIWSLRATARQTFKSTPAARRVAFLRLEPSTDMVELVTFGRRLAWRREWTFGPVTGQTVLA